MKKEVVFDSSFLLKVAEEPTDWELQLKELVGAYRPVMLSSVKEELVRIASGKGKRARMARVALQLASNYYFVEKGGRADDAIFNYSSEKGALVATVDRELAERLGSSGSNVISLKEGRLFLFYSKSKKDFRYI